jgi:hypothetical protein
VQVISKGLGCAPASSPISSGPLRFAVLTAPIPREPPEAGTSLDRSAGRRRSHSVSFSDLLGLLPVVRPAGRRPTGAPGGRVLRAKVIHRSGWRRPHAQPDAGGLLHAGQQGSRRLAVPPPRRPPSRRSKQAPTKQTEDATESERPPTGPMHPSAKTAVFRGHPTVEEEVA